MGNSLEIAFIALRTVTFLLIELAMKQCSCTGHRRKDNCMAIEMAGRN
jgi:hypothetical protein